MLLSPTENIHVKLKDIRKDKADNFVLEFYSPIYPCCGKRTYLSSYLLLKELNFMAWNF